MIFLRRGRLPLEGLLVARLTTVIIQNIIDAVMWSDSEAKSRQL